MAQRTDSEPLPSWAALVKASGGAILGAAVVLVLVVLPAEYGIDFTGIGNALGLTALAPLSVSSTPVPPPAGAGLAPVQEGVVALYPGEYKFDARELVLGPYEYVELKYHLAKNATMLFSWKADGDVLHDFHGDPDGESSKTQSYDKRPRREATGSFAAPFAGIHGWYWENPGGGTVKVRLATAGFYTSAHEFRFDRTRLTHAVRDLDAITPDGN